MRAASKQRKTTETEVNVDCNLDDSSVVSVTTGVGFFDHMLELFARHGRIGLRVEAEGDLHIDSHHTVEDVGIVLGQTIRSALGNKQKINRYGHAYVPMDESLGFVAIDISGRPFLVFDAAFTTPSIGNFDTELVREFLQAFAFQAGITLHAKVIHGSNNHHKIEAIFKALGRAFAEAITINPEIDGVNSTKGIIE
ncbi:imidazoleglycerol-phosphate dehydratase HisB [Sediminibacillus halophilus]|uniref:Imidazoleglycerol-phosphate dehydratase n=1 Tax=Sediminibacillus halophilus TaxID=482461 RepID=A0A1G9M7G4_9BACI|nr:imidazoleglycerol-phosphate dehydratase HisB [Sediminibacillus halophilus]SDL70074.1 imidazoleglycerol-phosphate dehydratase [Sediminibacillus halophilus]